MNTPNKIKCNHIFDEYGQCFECDTIMTTSKQVKAKGLKSLSQVADLTGTSRQTLDNWHKDKPKLFNVVLMGCVAILDEQK